MPNILDEVADNFVSYSVDLQRYSTSVEREVLVFLRKLERDLVEKLRLMPPRPQGTARQREARYKALLAEARASINPAFGTMETHVKGQMLELASIESKAIPNIIGATVGDTLLTTGLSSELLASLASNALVAGAPSGEWWGRQKTATVNKFKDAVRLGVAQGEDVEGIVRRVRGVSTGRRYGYKTAKGEQRYSTIFRGGVMGVITRDARALVITSLQSVAQQARYNLYQANSDVVRGVQALVTLDNRTTQICMSRSGRSWSLDGKPLNGTTERFPGHPPWHWRCRSTLIPILPSFDELIAGSSKRRGRALKNKIPESTQASMDGQVAGNLTYEKWLKTKSATFQKDVLGPTKYKLWKSGRLGFTDMIDQSGNPLSITELKLRYNVTD